MNRIKKLFGICEHDWIIVDELDCFSHNRDNVLTKVEINVYVRCLCCGKQNKEIATFVPKYIYWVNESNYGLDMLNYEDIFTYHSLLPSLKYKLNKKYNLNLTIDDSYITIQ